MIQLDNTGYAISWFFGALIVAGIAQGKGRSGFNWFLLSIPFSPPVMLFILVAFYGNVRPGTRSSELVDWEMRLEYCKKQIADYKKADSHLGAYLNVKGLAEDEIKRNERERS